MFSFDCGFTHVSHIWPDRKFHKKSNGSCCKVIGTTTCRVIDHFVRVCKGFACFLTEKLFSQLVLASPFSIRVKPRGGWKCCAKILR